VALRCLIGTGCHENAMLREMRVRWLQLRLSRAVGGIAARHLLVAGIEARVVGKMPEEQGAFLIEKLGHAYLPNEIAWGE
jgi:hypothetical protein